MPSATFTTEEIYEKNESRLSDLVVALQAGYDDFYEDEQKWLSIGEAELPDIDHSLMPDVYAAYKQIGIYPVKGQSPLTEEIFENSEEFYRQYGGSWEEPIGKEVVAFDLVDAAVEGSDGGN
jgi:hypothetical protein